MMHRNRFLLGATAAILATVAFSTSAHAATTPSDTDPYTQMDARIVIALDAGHGTGGDPGAIGYFGLREVDLAQSITEACKGRLEQYGNVNVVLTRGGGENAPTARADLMGRVEVARNAGASLMVSNHLNSAGELGSPARGIEVYVPNASSYNYSFHTTGYAVARGILDNLCDLGFSDRGIRTGDYGPGYTYPDGSMGDYLGIIRHGRAAGVPAILVEHGFLSNYEEANMLRSPSMQFKMGQADADAIAAYFGLALGNDGPRPYVSKMSSGHIQVSWQSTQAQRYAIAIRVKGTESWQTYTYDCTDLSYDIAALPDGTPLVDGETYQVLVQGFKGSSWSPITGSARTVTLAAPPRNVRAVPSGAGRLALSWDAVGGASRYAVAELVGGRYVTYTYDCAGTSFEVEGLSEGPHVFLVQANVGGTWSPVDPETHVEGVCAAGAKPRATAEVSGSDCVLSWGEVPGADRYAVAVREGSGWRTYTYDHKSTSYRVEGLSVGTHEFLVQAHVGGSWSPFSDSDVVAARVSAASSPRNVRAVPSGAGRLALSWDAVGGASRYAVAELVGGRYVTYTYDCAGTSFEVEGLSEGPHVFLVQANVGGTWSPVDPETHVEGVCAAGAKPRATAEVSGSDCVLSWGEVPGADRYAVAVREGSGWRTYTYDHKSTSYRVEGLSVGTHEFLVQAHVGGSWSPFSDSDVVAARVEGSAIMGEQSVPAQSMVAHFKSIGYEYPSKVYSTKGAPSIEVFVGLLCDAANAEGVRPEVLYAQAMLETGYLRFGGAVSAEQCNFGGIGAVDSAPHTSATFPDVYTGLLAQAQHLKAHASFDDPSEPLVDPRFNLVNRGSAVYVEQLGNGKWASSATYADSIIRILRAL